MGLTQLTPSAIQQGLTTNYNANAKLPANTGPGSSLGAVFNAIEMLAIGIQQQIAYVNGISRLATCTGADADSFCDQFGVIRIAAVSAENTVTFSCGSATQIQLTIPTGTFVATAGGTQYQVIADTNQAGWNPTLNAYVIPVNGISVNATVQAVVAGSAGNAQVNQIVMILSMPGYPAPFGITQVTNPQAFTNGADAESDTTYIARFATVMSSRWATAPAVQAAVAASQSGITYTVGDMIDQNGNAAPNFFSVIVNSIGQSTPASAALIAAVASVVQADRPIGMPYTVTGPVLVPVAVSATLVLVGGANSASVVAAANTALVNYLNYIGLDPSGATTTAQIAEVTVVLKGVVGVANVLNLTLNGTAADVLATFGQEIVAGNLTLATQ